jgi:hypothetical protein
VRPAVTHVLPQVTPEISIWRTEFGRSALAAFGFAVTSEASARRVDLATTDPRSSAYLIVNEGFARGLVTANFTAG